jgi:glutathione peroxidase
MNMNLYSFTVQDNQGKSKSLADFRGKVVLIVNTASQCGFTHQLAALQALYKVNHEDGFVVLAFPSNQFGSQEPGSDEEIRQFYHDQFGVEFPIMAKSDVTGPHAIPLFQWLVTQKHGLFNHKIRWNFSKFLVNRWGIVVGRYSPSYEPAKLQDTIDRLMRKQTAA